MKPELKPCPFCGSTFILEQNEQFNVNKVRMVYFACVNCKSYGPDKPTKEKAIEAWNTRPLEDEK